MDQTYCDNCKNALSEKLLEILAGLDDKKQWSLKTLEIRSTYAVLN